MIRPEQNTTTDAELDAIATALVGLALQVRDIRESLVEQGNERKALARGRKAK